MYLESKLTLGICQKVGSLDGKNDSKSAQDVNLFIFFFPKEPTIFKDNPSSCRLRLKMSSDIWLRVASLDLRTALKRYVSIIRFDQIVLTLIQTPLIYVNKLIT